MALRANCRACRSGRLYLFLSLGDQPPANAFLRRDQRHLPESRWPLDVQVCLDCGLIQVTHILRTDFFSDYVYVPSTSDTMHEHFARLADLVRNEVATRSGGLVVDIGCNDGLFLWKLHNRGVRALGIEPAIALANLARERGVEVINVDLTQNVAADIRSQYGTAQVITTTNTFNHIDDLHEFMSALMILLEPSGTLIVEVPQVDDLLQHNRFDTISHEHVSEFTVKSLVELFACFDLVIVQLERLTIHGGSIRVVGRRRTAATSPASSVTRLIAGEEQAGLHAVTVYDAFAQRVHDIKRLTVELLDSLRADARRIAGYGATAQGNTLLNFYGLRPETLTYLAERDPRRHGLFSPGMHIPVVPEERILEDQPDYLLVLPWDVGEEVLRQQKEYRRRGGTLILPLPEPRVLA